MSDDEHNKMKNNSKNYYDKIQLNDDSIMYLLLPVINKFKDINLICRLLYYLIENELI